jgi:hypothetical protein
LDRRIRDRACSMRWDTGPFLGSRKGDPGVV